ncbi:MAG: 50S ribosomal protein L21 [Verrucomicrobiota bacterium]|nr:50S ribosomal protein L21 [Verrucomicrobiota bacterium]
MDAYAVVETGGKQYLVRSGVTLEVERLAVPAGDKVELKPVLAKSDGRKLEIGAPTLPSAAVAAIVLRHIRGKKVVSFKKKRRKGYTRKVGHRQELTVLRVESI